MIQTDTSPLVSIGLSTYNRAETYLPGALESAINQTCRNLEVIVSDNCSSDRTEELVARYKDPRIRYFRQEENIGPNKNFNFCLDQARGKYFLLLHDDDVLDADMLEVCLSGAQDEEVAMIRTGVRVIDGRDHVISTRPNRAHGSSPADFCLSYMSGETAIYFCNTVFRTSLLRRAGGFRTRHNLLEDGASVVRLLSHGSRREIEAPKASFRRHERNRGSGIRIAEWCEDSSYLLELMVSAAGERADEVRDQALRFFARQNYNRLWKSGVLSPRAYLDVRKHFEGAYPPARYFVERFLSRWLGKAARIAERGMRGWKRAV